MLKSLSRRQIESVIAACVAIVAGVIGLSAGESKVFGPKFVGLQRIGRFKEPVYLTQPRGINSQLFVVERAGVIRVLTDDRIQPQPFLDIRDLVMSTGIGVERGLLSMAFAPDYSHSGRFYVAYVDHAGALQISEYRRSAVSPLLADPTSRRPVLTVAQPPTKYHGGLITFGPDGYLYIGTGAASPSSDPQNVAQDRGSLLGKILRIDPLHEGADGAPYSIPADNPFVGGPGRDEVWAYGLHDPWRFSFDQPTKTIAIGDVGDRRFQEIDALPVAEARGANFGWSAFEGNAPLKATLPRAQTVQPILAYPHGRGCPVTGGYLIRDPRLARIAGREVVGRYVYGDYCSGRLFAFRLRRDGKAGRRRSFRFKLRYLDSFGVDNSNRIYVVEVKGKSDEGQPTSGSVYRLIPRRKVTEG